MRHLLPAPLMSALLLAMWLMLNGTLHISHVALGLALAVVIPWLTEPMRSERAHLRRPIAIVRLGLIVLYDIVISNIEVARRVLGPESRIKSAFIWVPLEIKDSHGIAALSGIITMTPGTLTADLTADRKFLLVHCFHVEDVAAVVRGIKQRYEAPLMEIFQ